jgi:hypothetical protein
MALEYPLPFQEPKNLTLPDEPYYGIERLYLFDRFTRESFRKKMGQQAPPFDPGRRIKRWYDSTAKRGPYSYLCFNWDKKEFETYTITGEEAASINLPGKYEYPPYVVAPTPAVVVAPEGDPQPLNPDMLSYFSEATALAAELGGFVRVTEELGGPFHIDWRGEVRRQFSVIVDGKAYNAGLLLKAKNAAGIGAPGKWQRTPTGPVWVSEPQPTGEDDRRGEVPIPCRPLFPEEDLKITPFGVTVYRKDKDSELTRVESGGLTPEQDRLLRQIAEGVEKLVKILYR